MKDYEWKDESYEDYIKNFIADKLDEYEGEEVYAEDLSDYLVENYRIDGTLTYSTAKALEFNNHFYYEIGEVYDKLFDDFSKDFLKDFNPFLNPEKFQVLIVNESMRDVLSDLEFINENLNNKITLTKENINTIKEQMGLETENELTKEKKKEREMEI